jgi:hypothetical protein
MDTRKLQGSENSERNPVNDTFDLLFLNINIYIYNKDAMNM